MTWLCSRDLLFGARQLILFVRGFRDLKLLLGLLWNGLLLCILGTSLTKLLPKLLELLATRDTSVHVLHGTSISQVQLIAVFFTFFPTTAAVAAAVRADVTPAGSTLGRAGITITLVVAGVIFLEACLLVLVHRVILAFLPVMTARKVHRTVLPCACPCNNGHSPSCYSYRVYRETSFFHPCTSCTQVNHHGSTSSCDRAWNDTRHGSWIRRLMIPWTSTAYLGFHH